MPDWPVLEVAIRHRIGALSLNVEFRLSRPWTVLFAPSGTGKTTILRTIAGLVHAEEAQIALADAAGLPGSSGRRCVIVNTTENRFTAAHARRLPMVMQESALFPHLTVAKNVSFGLQHNSTDGGSTQDWFKALFTLCRISHLSDKVPAQLSGGERQRVALARALGANGAAVLLDEPFAGIDGTLKDELMRDVKAWLGTNRVPVLHVTHDVGEVFAVADEVIVLSEGRVSAQGPPEVVLQEERKRLLGWLGP